MISTILKNIKHKVGNFLRLFYHLYLRHTGVQIGKSTMISLGAKIDSRRGKVIIGDKCTITHGTVILSHDAAASRMGLPVSEGKTVIKDNVFIGVNSVITMNVVIGENSIIGAGSVVIKDIPPNSLAVGNPAKVIKTIR